MRQLPLFRRGSIASSAVLATLLLGCGAEAPPLGTRVAASTPSDTLTAEALRDLMLKSPAAPNPEAALGMVSVWVDHALLSDAVAKGTTLDDDATVDAILHPLLMEQAAARFGAARAGSITPTQAQLDSLARTDNVRVFRRYLIGPISPTDTNAIVAAGQRLMRFKQQVDIDGSTEAALRSLGEEAAGIDAATLPATTRQGLPPQLAATIWRLGAGEVSLPVVGGGGVQLFERLPAVGAREELQAWLGPALQRRADARFIDSLTAARGLAVADGAVARFRRAATEPMDIPDGAPLVTWQGGELSPAEARGWLATMVPAERTRFRVESDSTLAATLALMARREVLYEVALAAGIDTAPIRDSLRTAVRAQLAALRADASAAGDPTAWMRGMIEGRFEFRPQPGALPALLRERAAPQVDTTAVAAALTEAGRLWQGAGAAPMLNP